MITIRKKSNNVSIFITNTMQLDDVVGILMQQYYSQMSGTMAMSRHKMPCTRCGTVLSCTWRPGPCGTASLCNSCGLLWASRTNRPRMVDLVVDNSVPVWMVRDSRTMEWSESSKADIKDHRVSTWLHNETEKLDYIHTSNKKRKYAEC